MTKKIKKAPCEKCILYAICRPQILSYPDNPVGAVLRLRHYCSILESHIDLATEAQRGDLFTVVYEVINQFKNSQ